MATKPVQKSGVLGLSTDLDKKTNTFIPTNDFYKSQGWYLIEANSIAKRRGFQKLNSFQLQESGTPSSFTSILEYTPSVGTAKQIATTTKGLYVYNTPVANQWNSIDLAAVSGVRTGTIDQLYDSAILFDQLYLGGGASADKNIRFDANNATPAAYLMGIVAPTVVATTSLGGTGITAITGYQYTYSYYNSAIGLESNALLTLSTTTGVFANKTVTVTVAYSADIQVDKIRIYRTTDGGGLPLLVGTVTNVPGVGTTAFADNFSDATLTIAVEYFAYGVPAHFSMIEIYKGVAFMAGDPNNLSRMWFSANGKPANVNSNDFRDLDSNDGDIITGIKRYKTTVVAFKNNSIWNASGDDRTTFGFEKRVSSVGSVNNASIVDVPVKGLLAFISSTARIYFYDGVDATPTALNIEPILTGLNPLKLLKAVGSVNTSLNQVRWIVPDGGSNYCDLMIWYDYILNKWGTTNISNVKANYCTTMHDAQGKVQFYLGGVRDVAGAVGGGYVWQGDTGGTDDGIAIACEVVDRGHPRQQGNVENVNMYDHIFVWFKPTASTTLSIYAYADDPDGTPIFIKDITCDNPSGQEHIHLNMICRRLYIRIVESSNIQGLVLRGWRVWFKDVGRHHAP